MLELLFSTKICSTPLVDTEFGFWTSPPGLGSRSPRMMPQSYRTFRGFSLSSSILDFLLHDKYELVLAGAIWMGI